MMPTEVEEIVRAAQDYAADNDTDNWCQRLRYGRCSTRKCLVAGGWTIGSVASFEAATCPRFRLQQALDAHLQLTEQAARSSRKDENL